MICAASACGLVFEASGQGSQVAGFGRGGVRAQADAKAVDGGLQLFFGEPIQEDATGADAGGQALDFLDLAFDGFLVLLAEFGVGPCASSRGSGLGTGPGERDRAALEQVVERAQDLGV